ncbi:MAG TPA: homocysteine methyltransferase, partial [Erysipelotrichaceae bacterium]|nr:homocysteine methyltransferase [Erysipelotrichaceae bacterium]
MALLDRLGKEWLFFDGGTGTILQDWGLAAGELPETWNIRHQDKIRTLARDYFAAGSDIVNANTFGANRLKYPDHLEEIVRNAIKLAKEGRHEARRDDDGYVALDLGPTGKLLEPLGDLPFEKAIEIYGEVVRYGASEGADVIVIETMTDAYEIKAAVLAAKENSNL